jgi:hypothetical protein
LLAVGIEVSTHGVGTRVLDKIKMGPNALLKGSRGHQGVRGILNATQCNRFTLGYLAAYPFNHPGLFASYALHPGCRRSLKAWLSVVLCYELRNLVRDGVLVGVGGSHIRKLLAANEVRVPRAP